MANTSGNAMSFAVADKVAGHGRKFNGAEEVSQQKSHCVSKAWPDCVSSHASAADLKLAHVQGHSFTKLTHL